jgi:mannose-6-phosphate isomerase-like protein (cupin superfamily)
VQAEFLTAEDCFITELFNTAADPTVSVARARVAPGVTTRHPRVVGIEERYVILQGLGRMRLAHADPWTVEAGDIVRIPAGCGQRISNIGGQDLIFLCICTPRFERSHYELLE